MVFNTFRHNLMRKLLTLLLLLPFAVFGQTEYNLKYDSIGIGKPAGTSGVALYGKVYLKNVTQGDIHDSVLVVDANNRIYKIAANTMNPLGYYTYVFSREASDISGYEQMPSLNAYTEGAIDNVSQTVTTSETLLQEFATNLGFPNTTLIPLGIFETHFETQKSSGGASYYAYAKIYKRNLAGTETLLVTTDNSSQISINTLQQITVSGLLTANETLLATDRIVVKVYARMVSGTASIAVYYDGNTDARLELPSAQVNATNFVPYVGAVNDLVSTFDITADTLKSSASGLLYGVNGSVTGNSLMTFSNDSTMTFRGQKFIQLVTTNQEPTRYSTIFGYQAGNSFKLGSQGYANSLFGYGAGGALQSNVASQASSNSIFGDTAGGGITTGTANSIFGTVAAATGNLSKVISIGWHNMINATAGNESVSIGSFTLPENTAQSPHTIVGSLGAYSNTTGKRLTALGYAALYNNTTGSDNVGIGSNTDVVTGSRSIAIGTKAVVTGSNKMNIGNALYANGIDTIASSNARFGVGIADPSAGIEIRASSGAANTSPLKFNTGTNLTSTEAGAMEYDGTTLYFTPATVRRQFAWTSDLVNYLPLATGGVVEAPVTINTVTSQPSPTLGVASGNFRSTLASAYGLFSGVTNTGNAWMQVMRSDASATAYNLLLQPSGGSVNIGNLSGTGTRMVVADNVGTLSTQTIPSGGGGGTVVTVSVNSANGFAGTSSGGDNPALTLSTTVNSPVLAGNGTSLSAATTTGSGSTVVLAASPTMSDVTTTGAFINSTATPAVFKNSGGADFNAIELRGGTLATTANWQISKDNTVAQSLQLTPSTTNGGTTFTTPALTLTSGGDLSVSGLITGYAKLASPALTGSPTAPTQTAGDNSTKIATTAYVDAATGGTIISGTYTPTFTNNTNVTASTIVGAATYSRIGNIVHVSIQITIQPTASTTNTILYFTLPSGINQSATASNGTVTSNAFGYGACQYQSATQGKAIFTSTGTTGEVFNIQYDYSL
jgi:hypothetical protein